MIVYHISIIQNIICLQTFMWSFGGCSRLWYMNILSNQLWSVSYTLACVQFYVKAY